MLRRINRTTIRYCALGAGLLAVGAWCYVALRPQALAVIPAPLWRLFEPLRAQAGTLPSELIGALPSLTHTAGVLLLIAAVLHANPRRLFWAGLLWFGIAVVAEASQAGGFLPWQLAGTFDPLDLIAVFAGAGVAGIVVVQNPYRETQVKNRS